MAHTTERPTGSASQPDTAAPNRSTTVATGWRRYLARRANGIVALVIFVAGALCAWSRLPSAAQGTLWAEDARIFLAQAVHRGSIPALFQSYAGYLHTVPRTIAGLTVLFVPIDGWAAAMAFGACLIAAGVAALVFLCSRDVISWLPARIVLASTTILIPLAPREVLGNTANIHWYFLWLAPWLLLYVPRTRAGSWLLAVVALFAALTEIQMAAFAPLLLWGWRDSQRWPVRAMYLLGLAAQVVVTVVLPRAPSNGTVIGPLSLGYGYLINSVMTIWSAKPQVLGQILTTGGPAAGIAMLIPFLAAAAYAIVAGNRIQRIMTATLVAASLVLYVVAVEVSPATFYDYAAMSQRQLADPWLARYGVVPSLCLLAVVPIAVTVAFARRRGNSRTAESRRGRLRSAVPGVALALAIAIMLVQFTPSSTRRSGGPLWEPQVVALRERCEGLARHTPVTLAGAPGSAWKLTVQCSEFAPSGQ